MNNYKTLKFPKNYLIYEEGNYPKDVFYIITKGKAKSYSSNSKNYEREYDVGFIAGLMCDLALEDAVKLANYTAAYVTAHQGAACAPTADQMLAFFIETL